MDLSPSTSAVTPVPSMVFVIPVKPADPPVPSLSNLQHTRERDKALIIFLTYANGDEDVPPILTARSDADDMKKYLVEQGYLPDNITILTDDDAAVKPTRDVILQAIAKFMEGMQHGDRRVFFYAGHGCQVICKHHTETDGLDEGILVCGGKGFPFDSAKKTNLDPDEVAKYPGDHPHKEALKGFISDNELRKALVDSVPPGCRLVVSTITTDALLLMLIPAQAIFDTCHSGTILDLNYHWRWIDENFVTVPNTSKLKLTRTRVKARTITLVRGAEEVVCRFGEDLYLPRCTSPESILEAEVVCIASAGDRQTAWSKGDNTMTKAMLNILRSAKSKLTVIELMRSLLIKLRQAREESLTIGQHLRSKSEVDRLIKALKNAQLPQFGSLSRMARNKNMSF
ncbi:hypothetical protein PHLGIDRAFT_120484 [Phlebiopsis gigantea 11061_1 CR5-6]|uniref:Peptidase C14 caspase domain-containing protein n=1 Tax=Phlebiopsis gigantea (strain 11061_1 CR5-6) TaxID=745531 RepID=A0A0C3RUK3_PHLG1|nr:hypothetical protein PHLGIDRAFT_120484 [Phlebiopsis gigantea 11061_1 CR5-6]